MTFLFNSNIFLIVAGIISFLGLNQSLTNCNFGTNVYIDLRNRKSYSQSQRINSLELKSSNNNSDPTPLRVFQMTDVHISSFTSISRVNELSKKVVDINPDFVFLTGDYYTVETRNDDNALALALEPLKKLKGKVFACLGNHDYEQLSAIKDCLQQTDIVLLEDQEVVVESRVGKVQILGTNFYFNNNEEKMEKLFERFPRRNDVKIHITLVHNPLDFYYIKDGDTDVAFSGHFHG